MDPYDNDLHMEGIGIEDGDDNSDNFAIASIQVLPRVLLVDGDGATPGSPEDMTSSLLEALIGSGVSVDTIFTTQKTDDLGVERDAPAFSYEQEEIIAPAMEDFDIVIWVTGYLENAFSNIPNETGSKGGNVQELIKYLDSDRYLLIVGSSPLKGLSGLFLSGDTLIKRDGTVDDFEFRDACLFIYHYLGIKDIETDRDLPITTPFELVGLDIDDDGLTPTDVIGNYSMVLTESAASNALTELYLIREPSDFCLAGFETPSGVLTLPIELNDTPMQVNSVRSYSTPDVDHHGAQYRSVILSFDISKLRNLNEKVKIVASILSWFDWKINVGRDLAITKMELSILTEVQTGPETTEWALSPISTGNYPKYLDTILIEATVRNNGPSVESSSVIFYVSGPDGIELQIPVGIPDPRTGNRETYDNPYDLSSIQSEGGEVTLYKLWLAVGIGSYTFRVVVDPYRLISEISEDNNDISYSTSTKTSFVTQNNILIVDDDMSDDNFDDSVTPGPRATKEIDYSARGGEPSLVLEELLVDLDYDHEVHTVKAGHELGTGEWTFDSGLGIVDLKRYNLIIWVTGRSGETSGMGEPKRESLTDPDLIALMKYMNGDYPEEEYLPEGHMENVMFIGTEMVQDLIDHEDEMISDITDLAGFLRVYMGVDPSINTESGTSNNLLGTMSGDLLEDVYVGIQYY
ncbi:MAG: hypothetical protein E4H15_08495, partial [Syntrophobacterales bacterium]